MFLSYEICLNFFPFEIALLFRGFERKRLKVAEDFRSILPTRKSVGKNALLFIRDDRSPLKNQNKTPLYLNILESFLTNTELNSKLRRILKKTDAKTSLPIR